MLFKVRADEGMSFSEFATQIPQSTAFIDPAKVIQAVVAALKLEPRDTSVMLLLDGAHQFALAAADVKMAFVNLTQALSALINYVDGPLVVACLAATMTQPVKASFGASGQLRHYLTLPPLPGRRLLSSIAGDFATLIQRDPGVGVCRSTFPPLSPINSLLATSGRHGRPWSLLGNPRLHPH